MVIEGGSSVGGINENYTFELKERQHAYLEEMMKKHDLPDVSKALRCLINYAVEKSEDEDSIFSEIRCQDC